jgi:hypothetical protein
MGEWYEDPGGTDMLGVPGYDSGYDQGYAGAETPDPETVDDTEAGAIMPGEESVPFDSSGSGWQSATSAAASLIPKLTPAIFNQYNGQLPNLGTTPDVSGSKLPASGGAGAGGSRMRAIMAAVRARVGRSVSPRAILQVIGKLGWTAAAQATGLGLADLQYIVMRQTAKRFRRRRGPHLYTVAKRIRQGHHYEKMLAKLASKVHVRRHHSSAPAPFRRRRRR